MCCCSISNIDACVHGVEIADDSADAAEVSWVVQLRREDDGQASRVSVVDVHLVGIRPHM